ncbi:leucine-rich repeat flightless-interacting protein 2 isoform X2 [Sesamum indicum]|uniref:Leucine-rich repeat flightless-interacting protein 2 isoform X2 n=1 Tax=Sesamum indicum TaxID=4182 RepID=A0A6I9UD18_SESIN|nr:leucine-rich repeat flightless-interacting protein 2 isoform X2 [Sesamum indicum]
MASIRSATRYTNSLNSSTKSDPSSSAEFSSSRETSRALTKKKDATHINLGSMVKKLVENKKAKNFDKGPKFVIAADFLAEDLKKTAKKSSGLSGLHKKLFKGSSGSSAGAKRGEESSKKALTEVKSNTRTLAMVLRSERELLSLNKEQEEQIAELKILLEEKNREVEKLKDLCLKQREEIKSLKSSILFPDVMNSQLQDLLEKQGSELKQAKQLIPSLQRQVTSLTGQLQCLAEDLAEVKADKYSGRGYRDNHFCSPRTPSYDQEEAANSLFDQEFSSGDYTTPESPDDMFLKDLNPCLTPYAKTKSKEFGVYNSPDDAGLSTSITQSSDEIAFNTCGTKLSKSSDCSQSSRTGKGLVRTARRSDGSKCARGKQTHHKLF